MEIINTIITFIETHESFLIEWGAYFLLLGFLLKNLKYLKPTILWIKGGIENGDGVLQNKDLQLMIFTGLCIFIVLSITIFHVTYPSEVIYSCFGGALGSYGANALSKGNSKPPKDKDIGEF